MSSLLDSIMNSISPEVTRSLAARLGEPAETIERGLQAGSATMLGSLASHAQDSGFLSKVM